MYMAINLNAFEIRYKNSFPLKMPINLIAISLV